MSRNDRIKVCFVVGTLGRGGAERQLIYMLGALKSRPVDIRVLCLTRGEALEAEIKDLGVSVEWVGSSPSRARRLAAIVRSLHREPADIVQSAHFYTNIYAAMAATLTGSRSIGAIRSNVLLEIKGNLPLGLAGLLLPDYLIVNSRPARRRVLERGRSPERVRMVKNAVDVRRFAGSHSERQCRSRDVLHLLFVGRLIPEKRVDRFLRLLERADRTFVDKRVEARIVGGGPERVPLENLRAELGLDPERVQFIGEVNDTAPHYSWADLLVLTSDLEGTPNVILEAMASGLPVLATAVGGVPDLLCHGGGLMVRPGSLDALFTALAQMVGDVGLVERLAREGRQYVARNHSLDSLRSQLSEVYEVVMARGRSSTRLGR
ncbi:MAG: glycosyltransferase family 4 protein [Actinobacteria bacterium]|jgi:glycosyltransferase involved in cell wall biosynthesis|nr:glycosyltransferase family 4 protein [Actinomycetota bacterium]